MECLTKYNLLGLLPLGLQNCTAWQGCHYAVWRLNYKRSTSNLYPNRYYPMNFNKGWGISLGSGCRLSRNLPMGNKKLVIRWPINTKKTVMLLLQRELGRGRFSVEYAWRHLRMAFTRLSGRHWTLGFPVKSRIRLAASEPLVTSRQAWHNKITY